MTPHHPSNTTHTCLCDYLKHAALKQIRELDEPDRLYRERESLAKFGPRIVRFCVFSASTGLYQALAGV
jgi:hypothetical protein